MAAAMDSSPSSAPERARFGRPAGLPGVELLTARFVTQTFSRHTHEGYAIGVIDAGALGFRYRGEAVVAPAGSVNLVVPGEAHDGHAADAAGWAYRMFYLPPERLAEAEAARRGADPDRGRLPHFRPGVIHDPVLAAQVARVHDALARPGTPRLARQELLAGLLERWVAGWAEASSLGGPAREPAADRDARVRGGVARAREFLHQTFPDDPGLPELARAAGLSPYHLTRAFTRTLGLPPHAYLTQLRLDRARDLMEAGRPIADAALEAGFADQSHLTRCFKRRFGVAPGAWRKNVQES